MFSPFYYWTLENICSKLLFAHTDQWGFCGITKAKTCDYKKMRFKDSEMAALTRTYFPCKEKKISHDKV